MSSVTSRPRRSGVLTIGLVLGLALVGAPGSAWQGHVADGQGTARGDGVGPAVPGVEWVVDIEGLEHNGRDDLGGTSGYGLSTAITPDGLALLAGADTTGTAGGGESDRVLVAVDTITGTEAWRADDIMPECGVVVGDDGTIWAARRDAPGGATEIVTIDAADGTVTSVFGDTDDDMGDPILTNCDDTPLQLSADGNQLLVLHRTFGSQSGDWLRVFDLEPAFAQAAIVRLVPTDDWGALKAGFDEIVRVAPTGSPAEGSIYLFERLGGDDLTCCGDDDVNMVHALDLASLPAMSDVTDAGIIDRSVELGTSQLWTGAITVLDDTLHISGEEMLGDRVPADGDDVTGRNFRIVDDGDDLTIAATSVSRPKTTKAEGEHDWHFQLQTAGDGDTLTGRVRGSQGRIAGMDRTSLAQTWVVEGYDCQNGALVADAAGTTYFHDFCDDVFGAVNPEGRVTWLFDDDAEQPLNDGSGNVDLAEYEELVTLAVTDEGLILATGQRRDDGGLVMFAISVGTSTVRAAGNSRVETAVDISMTTFPSGADVVILAKAGDYPDALSGAPLAVAEGGPLLLTDTNVLSEAAEVEIDRLGATRAILLGGTVALAEEVEDELKDKGLTVLRIAGENRFETAKKVADRLEATTAVVVEGVNASRSRGWPDAVAASSWAAATGRAILLVRADAVPDETADALGDMTDVVVVGGEVAVSAATFEAVDDLAGDVERISGATRYATSVAVVERALADGSSLDVVWLATGTGFADALTAGPAAAFTSGVLLLLNGGDPDSSPEAYAFLTEHADDVGAVFLVGGNAAITPDVADAVNDALGR